MQSLDPVGREEVDWRSRESTLREYRIKSVQKYASRILESLPFSVNDRPNRLCPACSETIDSIERAGKDFAEGKGSVFHTVALNYTYDQLLISARVGCHLCSILEASTLGFLRDGKPSLFPERWTEDDVWCLLHLCEDMVNFLPVCHYRLFRQFMVPGNITYLHGLDGCSGPFRIPIIGSLT